VEHSFADAIQDGRRIDLSAGDVAFFTAEAQRMIGQIQQSGYDVAGGLNDLLPKAQGGARETGSAPTDSEVLDSALDVLHAVLTREQQDRQRRRAGRRHQPPATDES
jgi:hypothetical protein